MSWIYSGVEKWNRIPIIVSGSGTANSVEMNGGVVGEERERQSERARAIGKKERENIAPPSRGTTARLEGMAGYAPRRDGMAFSTFSLSFEECVRVCVRARSEGSSLGLLVIVCRRFAVLVSSRSDALTPATPKPNLKLCPGAGSEAMEPENTSVRSGKLFTTITGIICRWKTTSEWKVLTTIALPARDHTVLHLVILVQFTIEQSSFIKTFPAGSKILCVGFS